MLKLIGMSRGAVLLGTFDDLSGGRLLPADDGPPQGGGASPVKCIDVDPFKACWCIGKVDCRDMSRARNMGLIQIKHAEWALITIGDACVSMVHSTRNRAIPHEPRFRRRLSSKPQLAELWTFVPPVRLDRATPRCPQSVTHRCSIFAPVEGRVGGGSSRAPASDVIAPPPNARRAAVASPRFGASGRAPDAPAWARTNSVARYPCETIRQRTHSVCGFS